ncbi:MAG TPA: DUF6465 family protein [Defluviitaleaceae bacterium]|jgi:hypothetical protein|nr:DUF6465 family protein [Defluviitaleaceae bacterium]HPT76872.1 DUF6465 family protein [Defluviitaleaceae bacterium]
MREEVYFQFNGKEVLHSDLIKQFKEKWKQDNLKIKDVKSLKLYYNADEEKCYYVVNDKESGTL